MFIWKYRFWIPIIVFIVIVAICFLTTRYRKSKNDNWIVRLKKNISKFCNNHKIVTISFILLILIECGLGLIDNIHRTKYLNGIFDALIGLVGTFLIIEYNIISTKKEIQRDNKSTKRKIRRKHLIIACQQSNNIKNILFKIKSLMSSYNKISSDSDTYSYGDYDLSINELKRLSNTFKYVTRNVNNLFYEIRSPLNNCHDNIIDALKNSSKVHKIVSPLLTNFHKSFNAFNDLLMCKEGICRRGDPEEIHFSVDSGDNTEVYAYRALKNIRHVHDKLENIKKDA